MEFLRRRIFQGAGAVLSNAYVQGFLSASLYQGPLKNACTPLLNCYACPSALLSCPIGTVQHFMAARTVPFYALGTLSVVGVSVGRMTCGTLCPFGALQDLLYKLRVRKVPVPPRARHLRYAALLVLVFAVPYLTGEHWFSKLCPAGTLEAGIPWASMNEGVRAMIGSMFWVKIAILLSLRRLVGGGEAPVLQGGMPPGGDLLAVQPDQPPPARLGPGQLHPLREMPEDLPGRHPAGPEARGPGMPAVPRLHPLPEPQGDDGIHARPFAGAFPRGGNSPMGTES